MKRIFGWEDEFRVTDGSTILTLDELLVKSPREFFAQARQIPLSERKPISIEESIDLADYDSSRTDCVWTWYGGKIYDEEDSLVEASTAPVPLHTYPIGNLVQAILTGKAQIGELADGMKAVGVSSQLNIMLDSYLLGEDLCDENKYVDLNVPTQGITRGRAHKLGSDLARIMVHTVGPAIAYVFLNSSQRRGAIYRPRGNKRLELALPFVARHDQIVAGVLFSLAAVEYITKAIKEDLSSFGENFVEKFKDPAYYQRILDAFPLKVEDVRLKHHVSFRLGFEVAGGYEETILNEGSGAEIQTNRGKMSVGGYLKEYLTILKGELMGWGTTEERGILNDYAYGLRVPAVDSKRQHPHFLLSECLQNVIRDTPSNYLNRLSIKQETYPISSIVKQPSRVIGRWSDDILVRRHLGDDQDWHRASFELMVEDYRERKLQCIKLNVDRESLPEYLKMELHSIDAKQYLAGIKPYRLSEREFPLPDSIFVYGTFLSDRVVQSLGRGNALTRIEAHTVGTLYDLDEFPALIESYYDVSTVYGQLMKIGEIKEFLRASDRYEGADKPLPLFIRVLREVIVDEGSKVLAWMYVGNANHPSIRSRLNKANIIHEGRWQPASPE
ncbi:MAG: gamma-glutamylcyclotransferase [Dehalococcoidia bacterium]|nr:gamma-glutamylcyclotransferase [Dehalococcoidia bacterium]